MNNYSRHYQPINSYGVVGNCHSVVLISPDGSVDWGCLPDFDSPAIFCRLLDAERGGYFQIAPTDHSIPGSQSYLPDTNVLLTRFTSIASEVAVTDFMPVATLNSWPYQGMDNDTWTHREDGSCHSLVRMVECVRGTMPVTMTFKVTPDYAAMPAIVSLLSNNMGAVVSGGGQHVGLAIVGASHIPSFSMSISQVGGELHSSLVVQATLHKGERLLFTTGVGRSAEAARRLVEFELPQRDFDAELEHTILCWRKWIATCTYHGPYMEEVRRSALTLKMLTYAPTGAIVAAPTTSLPEDLGGERNWDYRYTWLRDATFTLYGLSVLGFSEESRAFTYWLRRLSYAEGEDLQIMYSIHGERNLTERELPHLSGYCNSRPVRTGNAAAEQKQLDVFGEVLDCIHLYRRLGCFEFYGEMLAGPLWSMACKLVEHVCEHWQEVDTGIWEVRNGPRHFVYSKVMCWVALDRGIRAAQQLNLEVDLTRWCSVRDQIRTEILSHGYNSNVGAFTQSYDDTALDTSNLLMPLVGFIAADDPRMRSTVDRISERLTDGRSFVFRYLSNDGLAGSEGTFTICTFWLVDNLALQGRVEEAKSLFERLLTFAGPLGLFSEEIDTRNHIALGNYPQAFTHIALINSALNLKKAERRQAGLQTDPIIAAIRL